MATWTLVRFLHVVALAFFVGGQMVLALAVVPAMHRHPNDEVMTAMARRFGVGSAIALVTLVATGGAMAGHYRVWGDHVLQAKLSVLVLVAVLLGLHVVTPRSRVVSLAAMAGSLLIVWLGLKLTYG